MKQFVSSTETEGAAYTADAILRLLAEKPDAVLCLAAGHSSLSVFAALVQAQQRGTDFSRVRFIGLDEWVGVSPAQSGSCANFLHRHLFSPLGIKPQQIRLFDALAQDPEAECTAVEAVIDAWGGIDFLLLGMGMNGHLALNEPGEPFAKGAHVAPLAQTTKEVATKYFSADMPPLTHGVTLGIANLIAARCIFLTVFGAHKQPVVQTLLASPVSEAFPASVLHRCPHATLVLDAAAAAGTSAV